MSDIHDASAGRSKSAQSRRPSVAYLHFFLGHELRPNAPMPIDAHQECTRLLRWIIAATEGRDGAQKKVLDILNELGEWFVQEYDCVELDYATFLDAYRAGPSDEVIPSFDRDEIIRRIDELIRILIFNYPDCEPLRRLLGWADQVIISIHGWNGKPRGKIIRRQYELFTIPPPA